MAELDAEQFAVLVRLADGIIPADEIDRGASEVDAAGRLAERVRAGVNAVIYVRGIETARTLAAERFGSDVASLSAEQVHALLEEARRVAPGFLKQLRMDVSALYLSDPGVWGRIGFGGPSIRTGGYADFDRRQRAKGP
jgi:Gluconate 2-dehydrogenase subunit 3